MLLKRIFDLRSLPQSMLKHFNRFQQSDMNHIAAPHKRATVLPPLLLDVPLCFLCDDHIFNWIKWGLNGFSEKKPNGLQWMSGN